MGLYNEKTMKVTGLKEEEISMEDLVNKFKAYGWMQSHLLPVIGNLPDPEEVAAGMDLIYGDMVTELEAVVSSPIKDGDKDYSSFRERVCKEEKDREKKFKALKLKAAKV